MLTVPAVMAVIGGVALLLGLFGGGLELKEIKVPSIPFWSRMVSSIMGLAMISLAIWLSFPDLIPRRGETPQPIAHASVPAASPVPPTEVIASPSATMTQGPPTHTSVPRPTDTPIPTATPSSVPTSPPTPITGLLFLYDHAGAQNLGGVENWEAGMTWANDGQAQVVGDPKRIFGQVAQVYVRGYGRGTETSWIKGSLSVPANADLVAIPLASACNGHVNETDTEAGIEIAIYYPENGQTVMTYASHILETRLGVPYIVAFADVSEFQGHPVQLIITLRQPDICAGSLCTHNADLCVGDLWFESLPDICTTQVDGSHTLYHYYDDPTPRQGGSCADPQPYYFVDIEEGPHNAYGIGEESYEIITDLPADAQPLQFKVYYGYKSRDFTFNSHTLTSDQAYAAFPVHESSYVNIAEPSRWMPINDNPMAVAEYLVVGVNTFTFNVYAEKDWEERSFDLWARFRVPTPR